MTKYYPRYDIGSGIIIFFAVLALISSLHVSGVSIGRWGVDEAEFKLALETDGRFGLDSPADWAVYYLTPYFGFLDLPNFVPTAMIVLIIVTLGSRLTALEAVCLAILTFPLIFQLRYVSKEAVLTLATFLSFIFYFKFKTEKYRFIFILILFSFLSVYFRTYYSIVVIIYIIRYFILSRKWFLISISFFFCSLAFTPPARNALLAARYLVHKNVSVAANSKIPLYSNGYDPSDFFLNYMNSLFNYLFPLMVSIRVQEIYMTIFVISFLFILKKASKQGDRALYSISVGMLLTWPLFVAELGTLARHAGAFSIFLYMSLFFRADIDKDNNL